MDEHLLQKRIFSKLSYALAAIAFILSALLSALFLSLYKQKKRIDQVELLPTTGDVQYIHHGETDSVVSAMILEGTISEADLADSAVVTIKLADGSITTAKIEDGSIASTKIADGTVLAIDISDSAIVTAKVEDGAITGVKFADGSVSLAKFSASMCSTGQILKKINSTTWGCSSSSDASGGSAGVASVEAGDGLTNSGTASDPILNINTDGTTIKIVGDSLQLADGAVTAVKLANNSVTTAKITDGVVTTGKLANGAITEIKLADGSVATAKLVNGAVTTAKIGNIQVTGAKIADLAVSTGKLADSAITTVKIQDATILFTDLAQNACSNGQIMKWDNGTIAWICSDDNDTPLSEVQIEAYIFDDDNTGTLASGTLALNLLSYSGNLDAGELVNTVMIENENISLLHNDSGYITSFSETDPVWLVAEPSYFNLGENETVLGIPAFDGGMNGVSAPFMVDSNYLVTNLNANFLDGLDSTAFMLGSTDNWLDDSGDTAAGDYNFTGAVLLGASPLVFEGATANGFETTFAIADPTADNGITFQDGTGTVAFTSDVIGTLGGLSDVNITSADKGDILYYSGTEWVDLNAGTSGQYLQTQGVGVVPLWSNVAADSDWTISGSDMYAGVSGNVGIGTISPDTKLHIVGEIGADSDVRITGLEGRSAILDLWADDGDDSADKWRIISDGSGLYFEDVYSSKYLAVEYNTGVVVNESGEADVDFRVEAFGEGAAFFVDAANGYVGIGTTSPQKRLHIEEGGLYITPEDKWDNPLVILEETGGDTAFKVAVNGASKNSFELYDNNSPTAIVSGNGDTYFNGGNVGIGTTSPHAALEIVSGQAYLPDGTNLAPSYSFSSDTDTGMYLSSTNLIFTADGSNILKLDESSDAYRNSLYVYSPDNTKSLQLYSDQLWNVSAIHTNAAKLELWANGQQQMDLTDTLIDAKDNNIVTTGDVGIGTTNPEYTLELADAGTNARATFGVTTYNDQYAHSPMVLMKKSNSDTLGTISETQDGDFLGEFGATGVDSNNVWASGAYLRFIQNGAAGTDRVPTDIHFMTSPGGTTTPQYRMVVDKEGDVGIGTTNPGYKLDVLGTTSIRPASADRLEIIDSADSMAIAMRFRVLVADSTENVAQIGYTLDEGGLGSHKALAFWTMRNGDASERMRINSYGNVGIGTTDPSTKLEVFNGALCVDDGVSTCPAGGTAGTIYAESTSITQIDLAENYPTIDDSLEPGEFVSIDLENTEYVLRSSESYDSHLLGIVSTKPGLLLGGQCNDPEGCEGFQVPIALAGRVPVKVSNINGSIEAGDPITSSNISGTGMKASVAGEVAGKALESFDPENGIGTEKIESCPDGVPEGNVCGRITIFVNSHWRGEGFFSLDDLDLEAIESLDNSNTDDQNIWNKFTLAVQGSLDRLGLFIENGVASVKKLVTGQLEVGSSEKPAGITLYDEEDGEPYCIKVRNGELVHTAGKCGEIQEEEPSNSKNELESELNLEIEPSPNSDDYCEFDELGFDPADYLLQLFTK